jgi:hypothetical protein
VLDHGSGCRLKSLGMPKKEKQLRGKAFMDELDRRIQALTPEDMLDTSEEDAQTAENFKMADKLHEEELARKKTKRS